MMAYFELTSGDSDKPDHRKFLDEMLGPGVVDHQIRQAIHFCWMALPKEKQTAAELEATIRRIVDRAIEDFREDCETFRK